MRGRTLLVGLPKLCDIMNARRRGRLVSLDGRDMSAASSSTPIEPPSGIPGNATAVLSLENSCVVGTSAGRLALHVLEEIEGSFGWRCVGAVSVHRGVSVDSILLLLPCAR